MEKIFLIIYSIFGLIALVLILYDAIKFSDNTQRRKNDNKFKLNFLGKYYMYNGIKYRCINATQIKTNKELSVFLILKGRNLELIEVDLNDLEEVKEEVKL